MSPLEPLQPLSSFNASQITDTVVIDKGRVAIEFSDTSEIYDRDDLHQLAVDSALEKLSLPEIDHVTFRIIFSLIVKKTALHQAIPAELLKDPHLFERLSSTIGRFQSGAEGLKVIESIKDNLPSLITLDTADAIVDAMQEIQPIEETEKKLPFCVAIAQKKIMYSKLFTSKENAKKYFESEEYYQIDKELAEELLTKLETIYIKSALNRDSESALEELRKRIKESVDMIANFRCMKNALPHLSISDKARIATYQNDKDPTMQRVALDAQTELKQYSAQVKKALTICKADLDRTDLLEYLIGPKGYLFDHYGFKIFINELDQPDPNLEAPFKQGEGASMRHYMYNLKNNSAEFLENEIRMDLESRHVPLPPRITEEPKKPLFTKPQSQKAKKLREIVLPVLENWQKRTDETTTKVIENIIKYFNWQKGIAPQDVAIQVFTSSDSREAERITLQFRTCMRSITLNTWDFQTIYHSGNRYSVFSLPSFEQLEKDQGLYTTAVTRFATI